MKIIRTVFFTICLTLINVYSVFSQEDPPEIPPPTPPNGRVPIDDHLMLLIIAGVLLGITLIYRDKIKKASI